MMADPVSCKYGYLPITAATLLYIYVVCLVDLKYLATCVFADIKFAVIAPYDHYRIPNDKLKS